MATYKQIYGTNVEVLASDPSNPVEGQIWYNSTSQTLKGYALVAGSWATSGPLNTARTIFSVGTQTASLAFAGITSAPAVTGATESYNGTSWTSSPNSMNTARRAVGGAGIQTAALAFGGQTTVPVGNNETWNGTTWTEVGDLNTGRFGPGGTGTNTAALAVGGETTVAVGNTFVQIGSASTSASGFSSGNAVTFSTLTRATKLAIDIAPGFIGVITDGSSAVGVISSFTSQFGDVLLRNVGGAGTTGSVGIGTTTLTVA